MREERRTVTVLAADLVGSTALSERVDAEEVKLIVGEIIARFVHTIEEFGGTVKDIAGDGVMALFGAPAAHEDDAERAVRAGLEIVQETKRFGSEVAEAWELDGLLVRVGVHTGPVVLGPMDAGESASQLGAFGLTMNIAARLQTAAKPNTVMVGESTQRLIAHLFEWGERQELVLKGKASPELAYPVTGVRAQGRRLRGIEGAFGRFVGRERELAMAREFIDVLLDGSGGVLFITGEPGIGKSRLTLELRVGLRRTEGAPAAPRWLEGRCVSYGESLPFWPYRELIREWLGVGVHEPELRVRVALRRQVDRFFGDRSAEIYPYLASMLGITLEKEPASRLAPLSPEALQYRTIEVIRSVIARLAEDAPLVVAIEDLHWADPTSLQLTESLLSLTESAAVLFVFTLRPERDHPSWRVKELAAREFPHRSREIALDALTGDADRELLESLIGAGALPSELERRLLSQAEGNPFYLEELLRSLIDAGALIREGDQWRLDHEIALNLPPTVEKVILARLDRLAADHRAVITAASVLGRRFTLPHLEGVLGGNGKLQSALHELQRLDLVRAGRRWPRPEYRFKHSLIQEAAYQTILTPQRTLIHRSAAEWLEREYKGHEDEVTGLLAHHWLHGADDEKAIAYLTRAGDKARLEYALDEAVSHYEELLPLLERRGRKSQMALVLLKLALALHTSLRFNEANETYQRAFRYWALPDPWATRPTATLRIAAANIPFEPDPTYSHFQMNIQMNMSLFDRLVERWPEATIVPSLAERWEISDDGLRYVFHMRDGLRWSDGLPLTAHDVEFGVRRGLDPDRPAASVAIYFVLENGLDYFLRRNHDADRIGVRALDSRTVEFRLVAPAPYFLSVVNRPDGGPLPRHAIERYGGDWTALDRQVVSGPFRRAEWSPQLVVLERRSDYTRPRSGNIARVELERVDNAEAARRYSADTVELAAPSPTMDVSSLMENTGQEMHLGPPALGVYVIFDHAHHDLGRLEFRQALAHAVNREALRALIPSHLIVASGGVVPPPLQGHTPEIVPRFDPDRARQLLERSGVRTGPSVLITHDTVIGRLLLEIVRIWEHVLGIRFQIESVTSAEFRRMVLASGQDLRRFAAIFHSNWVPGYPDPEYFLRLLLHSDAKDNWGGYRYPPFDKLIEQARRERSDRSRLELFHQADRMVVAEQVALIPLVYGRNVAFVKPWVHGWWEFGKSWPNFADLVVDQAEADLRDRGV